MVCLPFLGGHRLTLGIDSIPTKFAIFRMRIFKGKNLSSRNSATRASWTKILPTVPKSFTHPVLSRVKNKSPSPPPTPFPLLQPPKRGQGWYLTGRFPEPNNTRRKLRSIACARQIGFPPLPPR